MSHKQNASKHTATKARRVFGKKRGAGNCGYSAKLAALLMAFVLLAGPLAMQGFSVTEPNREAPLVSRANADIDMNAINSRFGDWTHYGAIVFDTLAVMGADTEGPIAVGKRINSIGEGYDIGASYAEWAAVIGYYNPDGYPSLLYGGDGKPHALDTTYGPNNSLYYGNVELNGPNQRMNGSNHGGSVYGGNITMTADMHDRNKYLVGENIWWPEGLFSKHTGSQLETVSQKDLDAWFDYWYRYTVGAQQDFIAAGAATQKSITLAQFTSSNWWESNSLSLFENQTLKDENGGIAPKTLVINVDCSGSSGEFTFNNSSAMRIPAAQITTLQGSSSNNWEQDMNKLKYDLIIFNFEGLESVTLGKSSQTLSGITFGKINSPWSSLNQQEKLWRMALCGNVIYSFPNAKTVSSDGGFVSGAIWAPNATFNGSGGSLNGQLIAKNYIQQGGHEIHALPITHKIVSVTEEPSNEGKVILFKYLKYHGEITETRIAGSEFIIWKRDEGGNPLYFTGDEYNPNIANAQKYYPTVENRVEIDGLDYDVHYLQETKAPTGFQLNTDNPADTDTFHITEIDITEETKVHTIERFNEPTGIELQFFKHYLVEEDDSGGQVTVVEKPLDDVEFHLFRKADQYIGTAGELVRYTYTELKTDADGILNIEQLPMGQYILREVQPKPGYTYVLEDGELYFSVRNIDPGDGKGQRMIAYEGHSDEGLNTPDKWFYDGDAVANGVVIDPYGIANQFVGTKTMVTLYKHDEDDISKPLPGATFTLWYDYGDGNGWTQVLSNETSAEYPDWGVAEDDPRYKDLSLIKTSELGYFTIENLMPGMYRLVEESAPEGYIKDNGIYDAAFTYNNGWYITEFEVKHEDAESFAAIGRLKDGVEQQAEAESESLQQSAASMQAPQQPENTQEPEDEEPPQEDIPEAPEEQEAAGENQVDDPPQDEEQHEEPAQDTMPAEEENPEQDNLPTDDRQDTAQEEPESLTTAEEESEEDPQQEPDLQKPLDGQPAAQGAGGSFMLDGLDGEPIVTYDSVGYLTVNIPNEAEYVPTMDLTIEKWGEVFRDGALKLGIIDTNTAQFRVNKMDGAGEYTQEITNMQAGTMKNGLIELKDLEAGKYQIVERTSPTGYIGLDGDRNAPTENDFIYFTLEQVGDELLITHMDLVYWKTEKPNLEDIAQSSADTEPDADSPVVWGQYSGNSYFLRVYNKASNATLAIRKVDGDMSFEGVDPDDEKYRVIMDALENAVFRLQRKKNGFTGDWVDYTTEEFTSTLLRDDGGELILDEFQNPQAIANFPETLIYGDYRLVEIESPEGYTVHSITGTNQQVRLQDQTLGYQITTFTVGEAADGNEHNIMVQNYKIAARGNITVNKVSLDENGDQVPLGEGVPFRLWQIDGEGTEKWDYSVTLADAVKIWNKLEFRKVYSMENDFITDDNGQLIIKNLAPGLYALAEVWHDTYIGDDPNGGMLASEFLYFLSHQAQLLENSDVSRDYYYHLTVFKVIAIDEDDLSKGVRIHWVQQEKIWGEEADFDNETSTADGWQLDEEDDSNQHLTLTVINRSLDQLPIDITLQKQDEKGQPLAGATFELWERVDFTNPTPDTDAREGLVAEEDVIYRLVDTVASQADGTVRFENVKARWRWNDVVTTDDGVTHPKGEIAPYRSHEDILMWSAYMVVETSAPNGYVVDDTPIHFALWANPLSKSLDLIHLYYEENAWKFPAKYGDLEGIEQMQMLFGSMPLSLDPAAFASGSWWVKSYSDPTEDTPGYPFVTGNFARELSLGARKNAPETRNIYLHKRDSADYVDTGQYKTDEDNLYKHENKLSGAQFALYRCLHTEEGHVHSEQVSETDSCWTFWKTSTVSDTERGRFYFYDIIPGEEYRLVEIVAPEGYEKALGSWKLVARLSDSSATNARIEELKYISLRGEVDPGTYYRGSSTQTMVGNRQRYVLPHLGGVGLGWFFAGGGGLMLLAGALLGIEIKRRRNARRRARREYAKYIYRRGSLNSS